MYFGNLIINLLFDFSQVFQCLYFVLHWCLSASNMIVLILLLKIDLHIIRFGLLFLQTSLVGISLLLVREWQFKIVLKLFDQCFIQCPAILHIVNFAHFRYLQLLLRYILWYGLWLNMILTKLFCFIIFVLNSRFFQWREPTGLIWLVINTFFYFNCKTFRFTCQNRLNQQFLFFVFMRIYWNLWISEGPRTSVHLLLYFK